MCPERRIVLDVVGNDIEYVLAHTKVGLQDGDKIFAVIGIGPHAVLEPNEAERDERRADLLPRTATLLWHIEDEQAPFAVPVPRLLRGELPFVHQGGETLALLRETDIGLAIVAFEFEISFSY